MATKIEFQTWSGGGGWNDPKRLIGYCIESPIEVLEKVLWTHDVYHYKELYRPIDNSFPNNVAGLHISEVNNEDIQKSGLSITITGNLKDLNLSQALTKSTRTKETIIKSFELCKEWHKGHHTECIKEVENLLSITA